MIISRAKNQKAAQDAINEFVNIINDELDKKEYLTKFTKFLAIKLLTRIQEQDCYFIDMLEDLERLE